MFHLMPGLLRISQVYESTILLTFKALEYTIYQLNSEDYNIVKHNSKFAAVEIQQLMVFSLTYLFKKSIISMTNGGLFFSLVKLGSLYRIYM